MKRITGPILLLCAAYAATAAAGELEDLRAELAALRAENESRIMLLEKRIDSLQERALSIVGGAAQSANTYNPAISLVLDGRYAAYDQTQEDWLIPGVPLGGEAGLAEEGLSIGHTELALSANIDDRFYGKFTLALAEHEGELELELEEAFFQTLGLGAGMTLRGGRFFSGVGYLNQQHDHAQDFADAPLVYAGLLGNNYIDDGLRLSWIAPTDLYVEIGAELLRGSRFPGGGEQQGAGSRVIFISSGGDLGLSHSWQLSLAALDREVRGRSMDSVQEFQSQSFESSRFDGDSRLDNFSLVYKWAPQGYGLEREFKLQMEYFRQHDAGLVELSRSDAIADSGFSGRWSGYYLQAIHRFSRQWRWGLRYGSLDSDSSGNQLTVLKEAGLVASGHRPQRWSSMLEWTPSEFSRLRLQFNRDGTQRDEDDQLLLQYTFSLGDHRAHPF